MAASTLHEEPGRGPVARPTGTAKDETVPGEPSARGLDRTWLLLGLILLISAVPRLGAVSFNAWPHGDVLLDAAVVDSLAEHGELKVPLVDVRYYPTGRFGFGYPPDQHPPLWPLLGWATHLLWRDSYEALKLASLVAGSLLIPAVYVCGRDLFSRGPGLFAAALCAISYLLIDFSGNGSHWCLLALIYVLFVWRMACFPLSDRRNGLLLGLLMAAGYLTNYPAVILPLSYLAWLAVIRLTRPAPDAASSRVIPSPPVNPSPPVILSAAKNRGPGYPILRSVQNDSWLAPLLPLVVAAVVALPWLGFSLATFGNPFWSQPLQRQLGPADKQVEVAVESGEVVKRNLPGTNLLVDRLRTTAQNLYGNVGFLVRQSFVLAPFMGGFALAGLVALAVGVARKDNLRALPLLLVTLAHGALILLWPTTKFRYLVPLLPLAALVGSWLLWQIKPDELRGLLAAVALGLSGLTSIWTFAAIPSHTYYYDGGVVTDNFGAQGEIRYVDELRHLEAAGAAIRAAGSGVVLGPQALYTTARQPLVVNSAAYSRDVVESLVQRYAIRYVVAEPARGAFYAAFLPSRVIWQDDRFAIWMLD